MNYCPNCGYRLNSGYVFPHYTPKWPIVPTPTPLWWGDKGNYVVTTNNTGVVNGTKTSTES